MNTALRFTLAVSTAFALTLCGVASAKAPAASDKMKVCAAQWDAMKKAKTAKGSYKDFSKTCLASATTTSSTETAAVPQPVTVIKPAPATKAAPVAKPKPAAKPKPVAPAPKTEAKPAPAPAPVAPAPAVVTHSATTTTTTTSSITTSPAGATGQCKDGTFTHSKTHSGACSHHGGVAKWL